MAQWPEVDADVSFSDEYSDLVRDGIDVAVRVGGSDDSRLVRRVLAPHRLITCAAPDYLARHGTPAKPEALGEHETLVFSHQAAGAPRYLVNGQLHEQPVRGRMRFNNVEALRDAAVAGAGLCRGAFLVGEQIAAGTLVPVLERYCRPGPPICAVSSQPTPSPQGETVPGGDRTALAGQGDLGNRLARAIHAPFKASVRRIKR